jgi:glycosyltransferase involved in cell wall biosynthesis
MISIVTPSFNRAYIIDETAVSILNQTDERWEWIVVDDVSTDDSWEKLRAYARQDERIRVFQRDREPKGACTCRNIGMEKAKGEYIIFLDTDDLLGEDAVKHRICVTQNLGKGELPYFPIVIFEGSRTRGFWWDDLKNPVSWLTGLFTMTPPCQGTAPLWPRESLIKIGGWREDLDVWQDIELHLRAYAEGYRFVAIEQETPDLFLRISPDSISHIDFHSSRKMKSRWKVVQYAFKAFDPRVISETELKARQDMARSVFQNALVVRDFAIARSIIGFLKAHGGMNAGQIQWMRRALIHHQWRLYKVPCLVKKLCEERRRTFPFELSRNIGTIPWQKSGTCNPLTVADVN